ncbi:MAG: hypothetical protein ABI425_02285 [Patescibacteria group bacterium]
MKNFSLNNISKVLTAKERAKLVAEYSVKEQLEDRNYTHEIEAVKAGITNAQINEYNFYASLIYTLQAMMDGDLQTMTLQLQYFASKLDAIYRLLRFSIAADVLLLQLKWLPKVLTEQGFEELYQKLRTEEFSAVFTIECLAEQEALHYFKSKGELTDWHVDEVQMALRDGDFYLKKEWAEEVAKQQLKINQWIDNNVLEGKTVTTGQGYYCTKRDIGKPGVTALSWYECKEKLDRNFNDFIDNKKELVHFCENEVAIDYSPPYAGATAERTKESMKQIFESFAFIKATHSKDYFDITLTLHSDLKEQMEDIFRQVATMRLKMEAYIDATKRVEACYFDGQEIVSRELWFGTKGQRAYKWLEQCHTEIFDELLKYFHRIPQEKITFEYPKPLDISEKTVSIKEESNNIIEIMVSRAKKESHHTPLHFPS